MANRVLTQFIDWYGGLSDDAKELVRDMVLAPKQAKSSPAPRAARQSSSRKKSGLPSAVSSSTDSDKEPVAIGASGGGD